MIEKFGGVECGKVIIVFNFVELLLIMCDIVFVLLENVELVVIEVSIVEMVSSV